VSPADFIKSLGQAKNRATRRAKSRMRRQFGFLDTRLSGDLTNPIIYTPTLR